MAKEILRRLYRSRRAWHRALWLGGIVFFALLSWTVAAWLAVHGPMELETLRLAWCAAFLGVALAAVLAWRRARISFDAWVIGEEKAGRVPQLWSTLIGVEPSNPFFARLEAEAAAAVRARRSHFRRVAAVCCLGLIVSLAAIVATLRRAAPLLEQPKIQMALRRVDDAIIVQAPASIARGEPWTLHVRTLQAGPWIAEVQGIPLPLTNGSLTLQSLQADTKYRIVTAWGKSAWSTVAVYDPVAWKQLRLTIAPPAYLESPAEVCDLLALASKTVVAGSRLSLRGTPAVEWIDPKHADDWVARADETDRLRPVQGARHGLWMNLPIRVVPDAPPEVRWIHPEQDVTWGPPKTRAEIEASDDWNVCDMRIRIRLLGADTFVTIPLYQGRKRRWDAFTEITPAIMPHDARAGLYELTPSAMDSAGQTTIGEKRFLEIKSDRKADEMQGLPGKEPVSLRGIIVALLDTLRDWNRPGREARLGRVRLELDAMSAVAETGAFRAAAGRWIAALNDQAKERDVEKAVQEMASIQQRAETSPPAKPQNRENPPPPAETVSAADIGKIETLQRAALDGSISPQMRDALQKRVQEQFSALSDALKKQLPADAALVRDIGMTQEKLTRQWSADLAKEHLQQLAMLKAELGKTPKSSAEKTSPSEQRLLAAVKGQAEGGKAVSAEELNGMQQLSSQEGPTDWSSIEAASEKWNRALQSGLPSLQERTKTALLQEIQKNTPSQPSPKLSPEEQETFARAIGAAAARGDWEKAEGFAELAQLSPALREQLDRARSAPAGQRNARVKDLLEKMLSGGPDQAQTHGRAELEKIMPIDPSWEPTVDKYFQMLNQRKGGP